MVRPVLEYGNVIIMVSLLKKTISSDRKGTKKGNTDVALPEWLVLWRATEDIEITNAETQASERRHDSDI